jgi:4-hydroxybenzoate polyprenyltransferase
MKLSQALRDAALVGPLILGLVLFGAFATKEAPNTLAWLAAAGVVIARFAFVASGAHRRGPVRPD